VGKRKLLPNGNTAPWRTAPAFSGGEGDPSLVFRQEGVGGDGFLYRKGKVHSFYSKGGGQLQTGEGVNLFLLRAEVGSE